MRRDRPRGHACRAGESSIEELHRRVALASAVPLAADFDLAALDTRIQAALRDPGLTPAELRRWRQADGAGGCGAAGQRSR